MATAEHPKSNSLSETIEAVSGEIPNNTQNLYYFWKSLEQHYPPGFIKKVIKFKQTLHGSLLAYAVSPLICFLQILDTIYCLNTSVDMLKNNYI